MGLAELLGGGDFPAQDYIVLSGEKSPGRATVKAPNSPRTWDKRKGYGTSGASLVYTGDDLSEFDVEIVLWKKSQFAEWKSFAKKCLEKPPKGARPKALKIEHPVVNASPWLIDEVVVKDVLGFEDTSDDGLWQGTIQFIQYRAPLPALGKPKQAIPGAAAKIPTAQDAADLEIQKLSAEFGSLL